MLCNNETFFLRCNLCHKDSLKSVKDKKFFGGGVTGGNIYMCIRRLRDYRGALVAAGIVTARLSLYPSGGWRQLLITLWYGPGTEEH